MNYDVRSKIATIFLLILVRVSSFSPQNQHHLYTSRLQVNSRQGTRGRANHRKVTLFSARKSQKFDAEVGNLTNQNRENELADTELKSSSSSKDEVINEENDSTILVTSLWPINSENDEVAKSIAKKYSLPFIQKANEEDLNDAIKSLSPSSSFQHFIHVIPYTYHTLETYAITIQLIEDTNNNDRKGKRKKSRKSHKEKSQPFMIDFCPPINTKLGKRLGNQGGSEMLLKAVAPSRYPKVYDLTAGFGQDSIIMAMGGASKVHMVEKDPIIALLLSDALRRVDLVASLTCDGGNDEIVQRAKKLSEIVNLHHGNGVEIAEKLGSVTPSPSSSVDDDSKPDVCYLDPMFPPRKKSAAVKKNMQILHGLFETNKESLNEKKRECEERNLLKVALKVAKSRVVVKRPVNAYPLGYNKSEDKVIDVPMPSYEVKGSVNRFDVYIK